MKPKHLDKMKAVADLLMESFDGHGFALLVFELNDEARIEYLGNCHTGVSAAVMQSFIQQVEDPEPAHTGTTH